ncbi:MAG: MmcQ/YjbR family DNA-binding protein [Burkholderiales bacterium]|nr:MmcQ/YjbR family DNA-binding protein [Burkholderiales bacterium]
MERLPATPGATGIGRMALNLQDVRKVALALPETTEEPHHHYGSFRVRGKIYVTMPPGGELLHIFVSEQDRELALAMYPEFLEPVLWGGKVVGVRANLPAARKSTVLDLVRKAYAYKANATGSARAAKSARVRRGGESKAA